MSVNDTTPINFPGIRSFSRSMGSISGTTVLFDKLAVAVATAEREACDGTIIGVCAGEDA